MKKHWWKSKTVVVNLLLAVGILVQAVTGEAWLTPEVQASAIVVLNLILRVFTKSGLGK